MDAINILITGANGQLGHEMRNALSGNQRFNAIFTDVAGDNITRLDITDEAAVEQMVTTHSINITARPILPLTLPRRTSPSLPSSMPGLSASWHTRPSVMGHA